ncbi:U1 small nuclear ribonucleoprotein C [Mycena sanguinolenta]|uniref:U1 small nuclear ribonucleoprotein C n=1 Tax=Mycena sanguinolenta TaxID=230812 RepID=A0A8H6YAK1_9AGAR|nr:U1 small nuclear ribonucleoprotein C [Mycena sanguinolenta]
MDLLLSRITRGLLRTSTMPKHYCDYCDVFLTHDSTSVRKAHNSGRNHLSNVRDYYASLGHDKAQSIIDQITSAYETSGGPPPGYGAPMFGGPMGPPPPGFGGPRPPFPPPNGFPPMMGNPPPFPPNGVPMGPPGGFPGGPPPFPPNGPPAGMPPFPPNGGPPGGPPAGFNGPPPPNPNNNQSGPPGPPPAPGSGPSIHPDRLRMMGSGGR